MGRLRGAGDARVRAVRSTIPRTATSSPISTDTVRNITNAVYVVVLGGTKVADKMLGARFPQLKLAASRSEARDIARPLARMAARRVDWQGDANDAIDALFVFFAIAGYVGERAGIDVASPEQGDGFDAELHNQISEEIEASRRQSNDRRAAEVSRVSPAGSGPPTAPPPVATSPQRPPAGDEDVPVLLADQLGGPPPPGWIEGEG